MYKATESGVFKTVECWSVVVPLRDNNGIPFEQPTVDNILNEILLDYPGFSVTHTLGYWRGSDRLYIDQNYQVLVDALPESTTDSSKFFAELKVTLQNRLHQEKIYVTKQDSKQELLSFDEFFDEVGLQLQPDISREEAIQLALQMTVRIDFLLQRLGYETVVLKRDFNEKKIIWERKISGIKLLSKFEDTFPGQITVIAADQFGELGKALNSEQPFAIIGSYEFQEYILDKTKYRCLVEVGKLAKDMYKHPYGFLPRGEPVDVKRFIEEFTMAVFTHYLILRDEGFLQEEIKASVGSDGSLQWTTGTKMGIVLHNPAVIPDKEIQKEVIRCVTNAVDLYEKNKIDPIAVCQAKAKNSYFIERAMIHHTLKSASNDQTTP